MNDFLNIGAASFYQAVLLFGAYSLLGWLIEVAYRSASQRRFINAGFLHGPFIPIYGFGAAFISVMEQYVGSYHIVVRLLIYGVAVSLIEYVVGYLFEKFFKLKLWDYSNSRFNIHGRVCLLFSLFWTTMAFLFVTFIHPPVSGYFGSLDVSTARSVTVAMLAYFTVDCIVSVSTISVFRRKIAYLYTEYFNLSNVEIEGILRSFKRLRSAFPYLNRYIDRNINMEIKGRIGTLMKSLRYRFISELEGRRPLGKEFHDSVNDILANEEFIKLKNYFHHNSSIYEHAVNVAYFSYRICKFMKLDHRSAARGALLHDFFLYDWRNHDVPDLPREKYHGIEHPGIALTNAEKHFVLNDMEKDIIVKHMWPLTISPPRYKESFIVTFADKYLSSREFIGEFKKQKSQDRTKGRRRGSG
ncbi:MAG: hypothetical protein E4G96_10060 [Chrysiogenales bacterium]|nr:MAG: hypothetical protein E4G96_10060 [Chrysiogenales bacterium]